MHLVWRRVDGLGSFRFGAAARLIKEAIRKAHRDDFHIVHFSIQSNHLHLIVEATRDGIARGMRGLGCRIVRGLNKLWCRTGKVFTDRFHETVLRSLWQVRNTLNYVLNNHRHHNVPAPLYEPDEHSSGEYFNGWSNYPQTRDPATEGSLVRPPSDKLRIIWMDHYPTIDVSSVPG